MIQHLGRSPGSIRVSYRTKSSRRGQGHRKFININSSKRSKITAATTRETRGGGLATRSCNMALLLEDSRRVAPYRARIELVAQKVSSTFALAWPCVV